MSYITISFTSGSWYPGYEYRPASTQNIAGHVLYRQWYIGGASPVEGSSNHDIKVTSDAATWSDVGNSTPNTFVDNGTTITIKNQNNFVNQTLGVFTKPSTLTSGPTTDQYGRLPSTAVTKTFQKAVRKIDSDSNYVTIDVGDIVTVDGGYQTFNCPTLIWTIPSQLWYNYNIGLNQLDVYGPSITRNSVTYQPRLFGGTVGVAGYSNYVIIAFEAEAPNSNVVFGVTKHYIQYSPKGYLNGVKTNIGSTTIGHSSEFLSFKYNITDNVYEYGNNTNVTATDELINGITYTTYEVNYDKPTISGGGDLTWSGFGILSDNDVITKFVVQKETNAGYDYDTAPAVSTKNGGGKPDRYPLIMTNLFNRNRSLYSIGMTHKDTWDLFL
jgi:hypothetical protein